MGAQVQRSMVSRMWKKMGAIDRNSVEAEVNKDWVKPTKLVKVQGSRAGGR
jgi:hypothetical protein